MLKMRKIIKRNELIGYLHYHSDYIKECCQFVRDVYGDSIYFQNDEKDFGYCWYLSLGGADIEIARLQINAICSTEFVFEG